MRRPPLRPYFVDLLLQLHEILPGIHGILVFDEEFGVGAVSPVLTSWKDFITSIGPTVSPAETVSPSSPEIYLEAHRLGQLYEDVLVTAVAVASLRQFGTDAAAH